MIFDYQNVITLWKNKAENDCKMKTIKKKKSLKVKNIFLEERKRDVDTWKGGDRD